MPQVGHDRSAIVSNSRNLGKNLLISEAVYNSTGQKTQKSRDQVIYFAFAGPGGTCTRSITGERHTKAKNETTNQVSGDVGGRYVGEGNHTHPLEGI